MTGERLLPRDEVPATVGDLNQPLQADRGIPKFKQRVFFELTLLDDGTRSAFVPRRGAGR